MHTRLAEATAKTVRQFAVGSFACGRPGTQTASRRAIEERRSESARIDSRRFEFSLAEQSKDFQIIKFGMLSIMFKLF